MKFLKILSLTASLLMAGCTSMASNPNVKVVSPEEFQAGLADDSTAYLLDVRKPDEFAAGHLIGAHHLNWLNTEEFKEGAKALDKRRTIYTYCRSGRRSSAAANYLAEQGYNVVDMDGGILAWEKAGHPVTQEVQVTETYTDLNDGSTLTIDSRTNCGPRVKISLFRLTDIEGIGKMSDGALTFAAADAAGNPINGKITFDGDTAHLTFTEASWEYLPNGTTYSFVRGAKVDYEPANPVGGRTYSGSGKGGGLATNVTIKFDRDGKCQCTSDFYQAFIEPVTVDGTYSIRYDIVEVHCQPQGFDSPIVWNFEIINDGQELGFNNSDTSEQGSIGTDWLRLKPE